MAKSYIVKLTAYTSRPTRTYSGTMRVKAKDDQEFERLVLDYHDCNLPDDDPRVTEKYRGDPYGAGGLNIEVEQITAPDGRDLTEVYRRSFYGNMKPAAGEGNE